MRYLSVMLIYRKYLTLLKTFKGGIRMKYDRNYKSSIYAKKDVQMQLRLIIKSGYDVNKLNKSCK